MDQASFWRIVEDARAEMGGDSARVAQGVLSRLRALNADDLEQFQELWEQAQDDVYRWPIMDAATLLLGPVDDDVFLAAQDWIVSHGRETIRRVLEDPDSLVTLAPDQHNAEIDWFCGLAMEAHIAATVTPISGESPSGPEEPQGTPIALTSESTARLRFPRLTAYLDDNPWIPRPWARSAD